MPAGASLLPVDTSHGHWFACCRQVHGHVLAGWTLNQMALAAQQAAQESSNSSAGVNQAAAGTLSRLDTFLAANWQAYVEFADCIMQQVCRVAMYATAGQCGMFERTAVHVEGLGGMDTHIQLSTHAGRTTLVCCWCTHVLRLAMCAGHAGGQERGR
jgi:hypothetical protein